MNLNPYDSPAETPGPVSKSYAGTAIVLLLTPFAVLTAGVVSFFAADVYLNFLDATFPLTNTAWDVFLLATVWVVILLPPVVVLCIMLRCAFWSGKRPAEKRP
jgi:hypothetical protein